MINHEQQKIYESIPHRPPFLFVDTIIEIKDNSIKTIKQIREDELTLHTSLYLIHFPKA